LLLGGVAPRVVRRPGSPGHRVVENEAERAFWIRGGEESAHRSRLHRAEEDGALDAEVVEHRPDVVHPSLERRRLARPVGEPGATRVEEDEAGERRRPVVEGPLEGRLTLDLDVARVAVREDDVRRTCPVRRIGDRHVAALCVVELVANVHDQKSRPSRRQLQPRRSNP